MALVLPVSACGPTHMQVRSSGDFKLPEGVNLSVCGCLSPYVITVMSRRPVQGVQLRETVLQLLVHYSDNT